MKIFNKVAIVGVGLIGGSLALALKNNKLANIILGVSRHRKTLQIAKRLGAIDKGSQDFSIIKDADLVVLATPVSTILNSAKDISRFIKPGCIVIDVGSTKHQIVSKLERIFPKYVGSHPLAGSEKRGAANAQAEIFKNSLCILTPTRKTDLAALKKIKELWSKIGAKIIFLTPSDHDEVISSISHLPHAVAFSLIKSVPGRYLQLSASGLRDTTRIALSDSQLWADIFLSNPNNILKAIRVFQVNLDVLKSAIARRDRALLIKILKEAKKKRELL